MDGAERTLSEWLKRWRLLLKLLHLVGDDLNQLLELLKLLWHELQQLLELDELLLLQGLETLELLELLWHEL
jgi:hypothetical protein